MRSRSPVASTFQSNLFPKTNRKIFFCVSRYEDIPVRLEGEQKVAPLQSFKEVINNKSPKKYENFLNNFQVEFAAQIAANVERVGYTTFTPVQK